MKDLGDLVKDINDAACEGQERAANRIAQSLVTYSPAWTGEFSDNWVIKKGYKNKVANVKGSLNPASIPPYTQAGLDVPCPMSGAEGRRRAGHKPPGRPVPAGHSLNPRSRPRAAHADQGQENLPFGLIAMRI